MIVIVGIQNCQSIEEKKQMTFPISKYVSL